MPRILHFCVVVTCALLLTSWVQAADSTRMGTNVYSPLIDGTKGSDEPLPGASSKDSATRASLRSQIGETAQLADVEWTGNGDGTSWVDDANWSTGGVPGVNDHAMITMSGDYEVRWATNGVNSSVGQITLGGASGTQTLYILRGNRIVDDGIVITSNGYLKMQAGIIATAPVQNNGQIEWIGGNFAADLTNDASILITDATVTIEGTFVNNGDFTSTNSWVRLGDNSTFLNSGTTVLEYTSPNFFGSSSADNGSSFTNTGTLTKTGSAHFRFFFPSVIDGAVDVQEGRLDFESGVEFVEGVSLSTAPEAGARDIWRRSSVTAFDTCTLRRRGVSG